MSNVTSANSSATFSAAQIAERGALINGQPPRVLPEYSEATIKAAQERTARLRRASSGSDEPVAVADIPEMLLTLMCHPDLYDRVAGLSVQLLGSGTMIPRDRELIVLRATWLCQAPYAWGEHVRMAKREGISSDVIERVVIGSTAAGWSDYERALLVAVEELHDGAMISDSTWAVLSGYLSSQQMFELIVLVGQFSMVAYFQNSFRFRLGDGNDGLQAR